MAIPSEVSSVPADAGVGRGPRRSPLAARAACGVGLCSSRPLEQTSSAATDASSTRCSRELPRASDESKAQDMAAACGAVLPEPGRPVVNYRRRDSLQGDLRGLKTASPGSRACGDFARLRRQESLDRLDPSRYQNCKVKMPASSAALFAGPSAAKTALQGGGRNYTAQRVEVPKSQNGEMAKLLQALKVANDLHKSGQLSQSAFQEIANGIQEKMDGLVCLWVPPK